MQYIIYYLLGGVILNLIYDLIVDVLSKPSLRFTMKERIAVGLVWPLYVLMFMRNLFIQLFKNNPDD